MSQQQPKPDTNGHLDDKRARGGPNSQLDIYDGVINPDTRDEIAGKLGTGYYTEDEQWQQIASFKKGMFGDAAFGRRLYERAVRETIQVLGKEGWRHWNDDENTYKEHDGLNLAKELKQKPEASPRKLVRERGEHVWKLLPEAERINALQEFAGITGEWMPPHWRMMETRHEASKSREARTQDNLFGTRQSRKVEEHREGPSRKNGFRNRFRGENR